MQVTEVAAEGLKREYKVVVAADEIEGKVEERLKKLAKTAKVPGFRPGKVPISLLKKQYGRQVMGEILEQAVDEGSKQAITENQLKPALRPKIEVTKFDDGSDLEFKLDVEVLPEVPEVDLKAISLTRQVVEIEDSRVADAIANVAKARRQFAPLAEPRPAADGDQVTLDFEGSIDGVPFEGGKAEDFTIVIGSGQMIPGFETALIGKSIGDKGTIEATSPRITAARISPARPRPSRSRSRASRQRPSARSTTTSPRNWARNRSTISRPRSRTGWGATIAASPGRRSNGHSSTISPSAAGSACPRA